MSCGGNRHHYFIHQVQAQGGQNPLMAAFDNNEGNIYFTHHFYKDNIMLEADIYVAYKK
ncbi:MAG: hypothetical protein HN413_01275 [Chloroflexi bacterium]|jgi:hypothetical protein|nr:hypothetical protein [Chloroflexota bacterium]